MADVRAVVAERPAIARRPIHQVTKGREPRSRAIRLPRPMLRQPVRERDSSLRFRGPVLVRIQIGGVGMKSKWFWFGGVVACLGILLGIVTSQTELNETRKSLATDQVALPGEQAQPVGWVFGRMIGFPGADKPLMPQSGSMGGQVRVPPTSGARP